MSAPAPAPGPVVAVCTGHRCSGLRRLGGGEDLDEGLRSAVRASRGGVLISCPCVGRCERGPVTVVGHHPGAARGGGRGAEREGRAAQDAEDAQGSSAPLVWLTESSEPGWRRALAAWVARGAGVRVERGGDGAGPVVHVPAGLRSAVIGCTAGAPLRRLGSPGDRAGP